MEQDLQEEKYNQLLEFHGGFLGAIAPFIIFIIGVVLCFSSLFIDAWLFMLVACHFFCFVFASMRFVF